MEVPSPDVIGKYKSNEMFSSKVTFFVVDAMNLAIRKISDSGVTSIAKGIEKFQFDFVAYGSQILLLPNGTDIYGSKDQGLWISLTVLSRGESIVCALKHFLLYAASQLITVFLGLDDGSHCCALYVDLCYENLVHFVEDGTPYPVVTLELHP